MEMGAQFDAYHFRDVRERHACTHADTDISPHIHACVVLRYNKTISVQYRHTRNRRRDQESVRTQGRKKTLGRRGQEHVFDLRHEVVPTMHQHHMLLLTNLPSPYRHCSKLQCSLTKPMQYCSTERRQRDRSTQHNTSGKN